MEYISSLFRSPTKSSGTPQRATAASNRYAPYPTPPSTSSSTTRNNSASAARTHSRSSYGIPKNFDWSSSSESLHEAPPRRSTPHPYYASRSPTTSLPSPGDDPRLRPRSTLRSVSGSEANYDVDVETDDDDTEYACSVTYEATPEPYGLTEEEARTEDGQHYIQERRRINEWQKRMAQDTDESMDAEQAESVDGSLQNPEEELRAMVEAIRAEREAAQRMAEEAERARLERDEERAAREAEERKAQEAESKRLETERAWAAKLEHELYVMEMERKRAEEKCRKVADELFTAQINGLKTMRELERMHLEVERLRARYEQRYGPQRPGFFAEDSARRARAAQQAEEDRRRREEACRRAEENEVNERIRKCLKNYEQRWAMISQLSPIMLSADNFFSFADFAWPIYPVKPSSVEMITPDAVKSFVFHELRPAHIVQKSDKAKIHAELLRFHPDKFIPAVLPLFIEADKEKARAAAHAVTVALSDLLAKC